MSDLEFRCLTTEDYRSMVDAIALEMNADVQYFNCRFNIISVHMLGKYVGSTSISNKSYAMLRTEIREMLDKCR